MKGFFLSVAVVFVLLAPGMVGAEHTSGIVPCHGPDCRACDFVQLGQNLILWFIKIMASVVAIVVAVAGLQMATAGGDTGKVSDAKSKMTNAIIGFVILLSSWLVINTFMNLFVGEGTLGRPWNVIQCVTQPVKGTMAPPTTAPGTVASAPSTGGLSQTEALQKLKAGGLSVNSNVILDGVNQDLTNTLISVCKETGENCTVTAAKNGTHQNTCHAGGTCFDVVCTTCSDSELNTFIQNTKAKGYCAVYEPGPNKTCPAGVSPCLPNVGTGAHFSFYMSPNQSPSCNR